MAQIVKLTGFNKDVNIDLDKIPSQNLNKLVVLQSEYEEVRKKYELCHYSDAIKLNDLYQELEILKNKIKEILFLGK